MKSTDIIALLPYSEPFLFVDEIVEVDDEGITGTYTFRADSDFYRGHFKGNPITPGVLLTETMAQIGVVCLGIYLLNGSVNNNSVIALSSTEMEFLKPVFPGEKVIVRSQKIYFRFGKLKCAVTMLNEHGVEVCSGIISGIIKN